MSQPKPNADIRITSTTFTGASPVADSAATGVGPGAGVGETLRAARESHHLQIDEAAAQLKIKGAYLIALEAECYDALPTATHTKGFLRSYAHFLGIDDRATDNLLTLYQRAVSPATETPQLSMPQPLPEGKLPTARVIGGALLAAALLCFGWYALHGRPDNEATSIAPPPADLERPVAAAPTAVPQLPPQQQAVTDPNPVVAGPEPAPTPPPAATIAAPPVPAPAPTPVKPPTQTVAPKTETVIAAPVNASADGTLRIRAIADSWVEVQDRTGATIFSHLMQAGQEYQVVPEPGLRLMTGNGAGIVLVHDGKAGPPVGARAEVVRNISLSSVKTTPVHIAPKPSQTAPESKPVIKWNTPSPVTRDTGRPDETD